MKLIATASIYLFVAFSAAAQDKALLLFDGSTGQVFVGCLNCMKTSDVSVCNRYGDFGSRYSDTSIWNRYGDFGSRYEDNSPWSRYGDGLRIVDPDGGFYGTFKIGYGRSHLPIIDAIVEAHEFFDGELQEIRDWFCGE